MTNTLYLEKRGCDNYGDRIDTDISNFRVTAVKYIPIEFEGVRYESFFEFSFCGAERQPFQEKSFPVLLFWS